MVTYRHKDRLHQKAKELGLASRASFKIQELHQKFGLFAENDIVLDLGAAPGGWSQYLAQVIGTRGKVIALDLDQLEINCPNNLTFIQDDIQSKSTKDQISTLLAGKKIQAVFSDMAPKLSGIKFKDAYLSYELAYMGYQLAKSFLKEGGSFTFKIFQGEDSEKWIKELRNEFEKIKIIRLESSRKTSHEMYVVCLGYQAC